MLLIVALFLVALWVLGLISGSMLGGFLHVLPVGAVGLFIAYVLKNRESQHSGKKDLFAAFQKKRDLMLKDKAKRAKQSR